MSDPKQKAKELVGKMELATHEFGYININKERHKNCALIAVEFAQERVNDVQNIFDNESTYEQLQYLEEVKQEILKL